MIPIELQDKLVERFQKEFEHLFLKNMKDEAVKLKIFPQHLPNTSKEDSNKDGTSHYPCVIIRLANGGGAESENPFTTKIQFIIGVIDRDSTNQGYRDALTITNKIIENIKRNPKELGKYEASSAMDWSYYDEDVEPFFFAGLETTWETPGYMREDVEDLI